MIRGSVTVRKAWDDNGVPTLLGTCIIAIILVIIFAEKGNIQNKETAAKSTFQPATIGSVSGQEYAYFEGQKDALEGIVRVQKVNGKYKWMTSPWNDGRTVSWHPGGSND